MANSIPFFPSIYFAFLLDYVSDVWTTTTSVPCSENQNVLSYGDDDDDGGDEKNDDPPQVTDCARDSTFSHALAYVGYCPSGRNLTMWRTQLLNRRMLNVIWISSHETTGTVKSEAVKW